MEGPIRNIWLHHKKTEIKESDIHNEKIEIRELDIHKEKEEIRELDIHVEDSRQNSLGGGALERNTLTRCLRHVRN